MLFNQIKKKKKKKKSAQKMPVDIIDESDFSLLTRKTDFENNVNGTFNNFGPFLIILRKNKEVLKLLPCIFQPIWSIFWLGTCT
jgi:hypothetical protein